jgi:phosphohistidine phosphatase
MNLYLLRHAIAVDREAGGFADDRQRPLTAEGRARLRKVVRAMKVMKLRFSLILTSHYVRARQTAEIVAQELKLSRRLRDCQELAADARPADLVRLLTNLRPQPEDVLLVGHEPYLSELVSLLLAGATPLSLDFKKAGLCKLSVDRLQPARCATLEWLVPPKLLMLMPR